MHPKIVKVTSTNLDVRIELDNGVVVTFASNPNYVYLNFAGIGDNQIKPFERAANQINIQYGEQNGQ
jgi:hypothetical protein